MRKTAAQALIAICVTAACSAAPVLAERQRSVLIPPHRQSLAYYKRPAEQLRHSERWQIIVHGLRGTPLHTRDWGVRQVERTRNRQLVPIRSYFLRASEDPDFRLHEALLSFTMKTGLSNGFDDRVLDISFGWEYQPGVGGRAARADRCYTLRLSATKKIQSSFFFRSNLTSLTLLDMSELTLTPGKRYTAKVKFSPTAVDFFLGDRHLGRHRGQDLDRGMFGLTAGWVPVFIDELKISAQSGSDGALREFSGLVPQFSGDRK